MEREQFTFYGSFFRAMRKISDKAARADIYDCLCQYALYQQVPDLDNMAPEATLMFEMAKPVLDTAREKSKSGSICKNKTESKQDQIKIKSKSKQNQTGNEKEEEIEIEKEIENELEDESQAAFDRFWDAYPRKVKKPEARAAFQNISVSVDVLLEALSRQKKASQWLEDGGRFVPYPASWLKDRRWEDDINEQGTMVPKGCGPMKVSEFGDMAKMMQ